MITVILSFVCSALIYLHHHLIKYMKACFDWVCATMVLRCKEVQYLWYTRYIFYNSSYNSVNERCA